MGSIGTSELVPFPVRLKADVDHLAWGGRRDAGATLFLYHVDMRVAAGIGLFLVFLAPSLPAQVKDSTSKPHRSQAADSPDPGAITDGVYRNPFFGISYKIPFGWVDRTQNMQEGSEPGKSMALLAVFERPPEAQEGGFNCGVVIAAEKASSFSGLKTAADYFAPITELAKQRGFEVVNEPYLFPVGANEKQVARADFQKQKGDVTIRQTSLVDLEKGWAVSFTFLADSEDEVEKLVENLALASPGRPSKKK